MERTWEILHAFQAPVEGKNIHFREARITQPIGIDNLIRTSWDKQLEVKQAQLAERGIQGLTIKPYQEDKSPTPLNALYEEGAAKMWPGPAITLVHIEDNFPHIELSVAQTYFPFIAALSDPQIRDLYTSYGLEIPRPPLAIVTFAETNDSKLTLTVRGQRTNMYPGRFSGQGGNPLFVTMTPTEHQIEEMADEILVTPQSYNPRSIQFGGIVEDREELLGKADLAGWVRVGLDSEEIERRVRTRINHPNDAIAVDFVPANDEGLLKHIALANPTDYCPPAYAGLILYGRMHFGELWQQDLLKQL